MKPPKVSLTFVDSLRSAALSIPGTTDWLQRKTWATEDRSAAKQKTHDHWLIVISNERKHHPFRILSSNCYSVDVRNHMISKPNLSLSDGLAGWLRRTSSVATRPRNTRRGLGRVLSSELRRLPSSHPLPELDDNRPPRECLSGETSSISEGQGSK